MYACMYVYLKINLIHLSVISDKKCFFRIYFSLNSIP